MASPVFDDDEVLDVGPPERRRHLPDRALAVAAAALLLGGGIGYLVGNHSGGKSAAGSAPTSEPPAFGPAIIQSASRCSEHQGRTLELGIKVVNQSTTTVTLTRVRATLPMGGLRPTRYVWGPCGQSPRAVDGVDNVVSPGGSGWFSVTFEVLVDCPTPLPVQFALDYAQHGRRASTSLLGFGDLGGVPYPGC